MKWKRKPLRDFNTYTKWILTCRHDNIKSNRHLPLHYTIFKSNICLSLEMIKLLTIS